MQALESNVSTCPERLGESHLTQFREEGYLVFENVLALGEVAAARAALTELIGGLLKSARQGEAKVVQADPKKATHNYAGAHIRKANSPFFILFEPDALDPLSLDPAEAELKLRKLQDYHQEHPVFQAMIGHPRIKGVVETLLGNEAIMFSDTALSKPPFIGTEKPWHQDNAYFVYVPMASIVTVWIALDDATVENGCMHVIPRGHRMGALKHVHKVDCQIVQDRLDVSRAVPVELRAGGAMFFSGLLPHQSPPNRSPLRRRALQFWYRGADTRALTREEYSRVFVEADGTPASCAVAERVAI
ncbi:MAG: phytanoyl-CoA dioxygenase family protein [Candidatus Latescibacteria bacterium]|nr:phytanoyl-CoA dioxygenase family protein [Candidatus Latescibacterota bacterium]